MVKRIARFCMIVICMGSVVPALGQQTTILDEAHQGQGNKGVSFRPVDTMGNPAPFVLTARSDIASNATNDPDAAGSIGTVCIDWGTKGCGVQNTWGGGSRGISGSGDNQNEELTLLFDGAVPASSISLYLTGFSPGSGLNSAEDSVIFLLSSGNMGEYDYTIGEQEISSAFTNTGSATGHIDFSGFNSIPSNLRIHEVKFRMTRRHAAVVQIRSDDPAECESVADGKAAICHIPPGNPSNSHTIIVSQSAVAAHLAHGDSSGECEECPGNTGACCFEGNSDPSRSDDDNGGNCQILSESDCAYAGGTFLGVGTTCDQCTPLVGACCFGDGTCQVISETSCATLGGDFQLGVADCPSAGTTRYRLHNHPDGGAAPPLYGLRLDGLLTGDASDIFTFDFDHAQSAMFMDVSATTIHIFGRAFGGPDVGSLSSSGGVWLIDFSYVVGVTTAAGDDDLVVNNCGSANVGTIQATFGSNQTPIDLVAHCGNNPIAFRFGDEDDDNGHRGFAGLSGWGWLNHSGLSHLSASDWLFTAEAICPEPPQTGACCKSDGTCDVLTEADCAKAKGNYLGNDTSCSDCPPLVGACCQSDGTCNEISELSCGVLGGNFLGVGTTCADCPPLTGACCKNDGTCSVMSQADCMQAGGNYLGDNTTCDQCPPLVGACCMSDGVCHEISDLSCQVLGGNFLGNGTTCADCPPLTGACCKNDSTCSVMSQADCVQAGGNYLGDNTTCDQCPPLVGACCMSDGVCHEISDLSCQVLGGNFLGNGTTCADCPPVTGACCKSDGTCTVMAEPDCTKVGGNFLGANTTCSQCPPISGACCFSDGRDCVEISDFSCGVLGGDFQGAGTTCAQANCPVIPDCNNNGTADADDISSGTSQDCNNNGKPDECEIDVNSNAPGGPFFCTMNCDPDCNNNGIPDECDISGGTSKDCNGNNIPDECDIGGGTSEDCNNNGIPDECEIDVNSTAPGGPFFCTMNCDPDCNNNGIPDECDISSGTSKDCNGNNIPDECDISGGTSEDCNNNGIPDECEIDVNSTAPGGPFFCTTNCDPDCNNNGIPDECDIANCDGSPDCQDCNGNSIPDGCEIPPIGNGPDCNNNGIPDECDIANCDGSPACSDCNGNGIPDQCDIDGGTSKDCNNNGKPDECEIDVNSTAPGGPFFCTMNCDPDCNNNGIPDECDISSGTSKDCNNNGIPDECDIANCEGMPECSDCNGNGIPDGCEVVPTGNEPDCNSNGIPDSCEADCNGNGVPDDCDVDPTDPDGNGQVSEDCDGNMVPDECQPDTDGDGVIDPCDLCEGTNAGDSVDTNGCAFITCDAGGPYSAVCSGGVVTIDLNGSATGQVIPPPETMLVVEWSTDCAGAVIADPNSEQTTITIDTAVTGCPLACSITFTCRFVEIPGTQAFAAAAAGAAPPLPSSTSTGTIGLFLDCNGNMTDDVKDIADGTSQDCNGNGIPDECEVAQTDCNSNGVPDDCDIDPSDPDGDGNVSPDCNSNGIPDECELPPIGTGADCNSNGIPDECDLDSDGNGVPDDCQPPAPQPEPPCDPNESPISLLFTLLFHAPVCGMGCPSMLALTICGLMVMKTTRRRRVRRRRRR